MTCLIDNKDNNKNVDSLARDLSTIDGKLKVDLVERNHQIAYHILACNNGFFPEFDPDGNKSKLFDMLMLKYGNNRHMAIMTKSYIYTPQFAAKYGNWMVEGKPEPSYEDIQDDIERKDIQKLFPNSNIEELELFIQSCFDAQILNDPNVDHFIDLPNGIKEDRQKFVQDRINEEGYVGDPIQRQIYWGSVYNQRKINEILQNIRKKLADTWKIKFDEDGNAINPYKKSEEKNLNVSNYDVYQFRCNLLNTLNKSITTNYDGKRLLYENRQTKVLLNIIRSFLLNQNDIQVRQLTVQMVDAYVDLFKGTNTVIQALKLSGKLESDSHGNVTQESIDKAVDEFKKELAGDAYLYSEDNRSAKIRRKVSQFLATVNNWFVNARYFISNMGILTKHTIPTIGVGVGVFLLSSNLAVAIGAGAVAGFASHVMSKNFKESYPDDYDACQNYHECLRQVFIACSLNEPLFLSEDASEYDSLISEMLSESRGDKLQKTLLHLKNNITKQLKSLQAAAEDVYSNDSSKRKSQIDRLKEIQRFCEQALLAGNESRTDKAHTFLNEYLTYADEQLDKAVKRLDEMAKDIENIDPHELMRLKTDVIWPYGNTIGQYLLSNWVQMGSALPGDTFDGDTYQWFNLIENILTPRILLAKKNFSDVTTKYVESQVKDYLKETVGKTVPDKQYDIFEANTIKWLSNQIANGNIGMLDSMVMPARDNTSPIVRMAAQRLKEIETIVQREANEAGAEIERIRVLEREFNFEKPNEFGRKLNERLFINPFIRFCERDEDGKFTGMFVSDTKYGQYYKDASNERDFLIKKWDIKTSKKELLWDEETPRTYKSVIYIDGKRVQQDFDSKWQAYQTDIIMWMAGAERGEDGIYRLNSSVQPRVHRRYKYQYYLDKVAILGKDGCSILSSINADIANIQKDCLTTITVNGKQKRVPIIAKLNSDQRKRLQMLMNQKHDLQNSRYIKLDDDLLNIVGIKQHDLEYDRQLSERFYKWNQKKREYYIEYSKPSYDLYNAVKEDYERRIQELKDNENFDQANKLQAEFNQFVLDSTQRTFKEELTSRIKKGRKIEYDMSDPITREYFELRQLLSSIRYKILSANKNRTPDLSRIGNDEEVDPKSHVVEMWKDLKLVDKRITELYDELQILNQEDPEDDPLRVYERNQLIQNELIPLLDDNGEETNTTFVQYLKDTYDLTDDDLKYEGTDGNMHWLTLLKRPGFKTTVLDIKRKLPDGTKVDAFSSFDDAYEDRPTGIFAESQSIMADNEFDEDSTEYIQVNKKNARYDNSKEYNKIKDNELYIALTGLMDKAWENYPGMTRKNRFLLPQREASVSNVWGRGISQGFSGIADAWKYMWGSAFNITTRDADVNETTLTRSDGTVVELVPSRWLSSIADSNLIDSDLVSSVIDFYTESLRYKYRSRLVPVMEALLFTVSGGAENAADAGSSAQANMLRSEMSRALYGRETTGSGQNGRISPSEAHLVKVSKIFRSALHKRLMSHNFLSVLKNGFDSFCNLCSQVFMAKYIMTQNIIRALGRLIYCGDGSRVTLFSQIVGLTRSKATNMTTALMQLNGIHKTVHERFEGQNKWALRRLAEMAPTIEFEAVDYTSKALITEAVYDSYRLMWNPVTAQYQYMNENEAEYAYMQAGGREAGYKAWNNAKNNTLRDAYKYDSKTGTVSLKDTVKIGGKELSVLDLIRPKSNLSITDDKRSQILETKIRTEITQMSSVVNGMLESEDKNRLAKHYAGAVITAFRGWMISQSGEYYKNGSDFYNWDDDADMGRGLKKFMYVSMMLKTPSKLRGSLQDRNFEGQYNFATGTIDKGLHVDLKNVILKNFGAYLSMVIPGVNMFDMYMGDAKSRFLKGGKNRSIHDFHQLRHVAAATDAMLLTLMLAYFAFSWYNGGDDNDPYSIKVIRSLLYAAAVASIVERFPSLGTVPFVLGGMDIVNAVTVGKVLFDDAKYVWNTAIDCIRDGQSLIDEGRIDDTDEMYQTLINGSFEGRTKKARNITRALALFNIDTLPILLAMDVANQFGAVPGADKDTKFRDYNLNYTKNVTVKSNINRANWYLDQTPANWLSYVMQQLGLPINKPKQETKANKKSTVINYGDF